MNFSDTISSFSESGASGPWGWLTLVSYIQDPQKTFLDSLRRSIPGRELPPVHITVLPPRALPFSVEDACIRVEAITRETVAFEAELSVVRFFSQTDFLYLDIAEGNNRICELHEKLNAGDLGDREMHEFRPHLTLGGPIPRNRLQDAQQLISNEWRESVCPRRVFIEELVCLWLDPTRENKEWMKYRSFSLKTIGSQAPISMAAEATRQRSATGAPLPDAFGRPGS